jgi:hypothetical protein
LEFYQQRLAKAQQAGAQSNNPVAAQTNTNLLAERLNWLQKFAAMNQQGASNGINTVA